MIGYRGGDCGRLARRGANRMFNRYMGVDYSGALTPTASLNGHAWSKSNRARVGDYWAPLVGRSRSTIYGWRLQRNGLL